MKRFSISIATLLSLVIATSMQAQTITAEEAKGIAENFFAQGMKCTRSAQPELAKIWDSSIISNATRSAADEAPTFYAFAADNGFVIVAGEQISNPVIGYSFDGSLSSELPTGLVDYLTDIDSQIKAKRVAGTTTRVAVTDEATIGNVIINLNTAKWGQNAPFNKLCFTKSGAQAKTGCIPTAMAIVMRHHKWPESRLKKLYNPITGVPVEAGEMYNWDNMPLDYSQDYTEEQATQVATIMRDLGYAYGVSYGTGSTDGNPGADKMATFFGYVNVTTDHSGNGMSARWYVGEDEWVRLIKESLEAGCPIPYQAINSGSGSDAKHIFVLDGYTDNGYYHFNWGWNGSFNGYFTLSKMDPTATDEYAGSKSGEHNAIFNLKPLRQEITVSASVNNTEYGVATVNGATSVTVEEGTEITLSATPKTGYAFVNWTADGNVISNTAATTITAGKYTEYVANFALEEELVLVTVSATTSEGGTATVDGEASATIKAGNSVTLIAVPDNGYTFVNWTANDVEVSKQSTFTTVATEDIIYKANFVANTKTVTIKLNVSGGTRYINEVSTYKTEVNVGSEVTLRTDDGGSGNTFAFFTIDAYHKDGGTIVSNKNPYTFTATEDATYYINYVGYGVLEGTDLTADISVTATTGGSANANGSISKEFALGEEITLNATANEGYLFTGWFDSDNNLVSASLSHTFVVTGSMRYNAEFKPITTNVESVAFEEETVIYDLSGRRIEKITQPGIYIVNGKKSIVK